MAWQHRSSSGREEIAMTRSRSRGESDPEKEPFRTARRDEGNDTDDDAHSSSSSRTTSSSYQPVRSRAFPTKSRFTYLLRVPAASMRWVCLGLAATLLLFMFGLVHLSWRADKQVQVAIGEKHDKPQPHQWESFPDLKSYFGGVRNLVAWVNNVPDYPSSADEGGAELLNSSQTHKRAVMDSVVFNPYPDYSSPDYIAKHGQKKDCFLDAEGTIAIPKVRMYEGVPKGFPDPVMGSNALLGIRHDVCFDRFGRLGPYGLGYSLNRGGSGALQEGEREGADLVWQSTPEVDFRKVKWAEVQNRCLAANKHRFAELPKPQPDRFRGMQIGSVAKREEVPADLATPDPPAEPVQPGTTGAVEKLPRTAVVIRTWWDYQYTPEDLIYLRSIISELTLLTGGEYVVHFLVQVKDDNAQIWADDEVYQRVLHDSLPEEFRGMGTLWTERQMFLVYGGLEETWMRGLPVHGVYRSTFMPMQYFAYTHPEYDFFWNWEMDIRHTGHWYHLFDKVGTWAKNQPRKLLWERGGRFYVPTEHGTWEDFSQMVRIQTEMGTNSANNVWSGLKAGGLDVPGGSKQEGDKPIWGPERPLDDDVAFDTDPVPPTTYAQDKYSWGVGEEADLITFNPFFDPDGTTWLLTEDTTGYNRTRGQPPRRTAIITASRLSRRLLTTMHRETSKKRHTMFSEMWPASCALHHGFKAVYAPHSEFVEKRWPTKYLASTFNGGRNGATGGSRTSVFGDREHNFRTTTWYYNAGFPEVLWNRWLGRRFNNEGGEAFEMAGEGRMCLPAMLIHPIKRIDLAIEGLRDP